MPALALDSITTPRVGIEIERTNPTYPTPNTEHLTPKWGDHERKTLELTQTALINKIAERFKDHIRSSENEVHTVTVEKPDKRDSK